MLTPGPGVIRTRRDTIKPLYTERGVYMKKVIAVLSAAALAGCSLTLPVRGTVQNSDETFDGTATGGLDGSGQLTLKSSKGPTCTGKFVYVSGRTGEGVFNCSDGRTGPFRFVSTGTSGTGHGDLGNQRFTFTFGN